MKNVFSRIFICLTAIFFLCSPAIVRADGACDMKVVHPGISAIAPSGAEVWLQNVSGAACGSIASNGIAQFYLSTSNTDKALALVLTAASLKKNVRIYYTGTQAPYIIAFLNVLDITD